MIYSLLTRIAGSGSLSWKDRGRYLSDVLQLSEQVRRERRMLTELDDRLLRDIGVSRAQMEREARRGYLDLPTERIPEVPDDCDGSSSPEIWSDACVVSS